MSLLPDPDLSRRVETTTSPSAVIPDYMEAVIGYRTWMCIDGILFSAADFGRTPVPGWPSRLRRQASCRYLYDHKSPAEHCTCGIYAADSPRAAPSGMVRGKVALWGKVIPGEHGWRAEYAYPVELWAPARHAERLRERYGVPVHVEHDRLDRWKRINRNVRRVQSLLAAWCGCFGIYLAATGHFLLSAVTLVSGIASLLFARL